MIEVELPRRMFWTKECGRERREMRVFCRQRDKGIEVALVQGSSGAKELMTWINIEVLPPEAVSKTGALGRVGSISAAGQGR